VLSIVLIEFGGVTALAYDWQDFWLAGRSHLPAFYRSMHWAGWARVMSSFSQWLGCWLVGTV